jgi:hypothetical protein
MHKLKTLSPVFLLALLLSGCVSTTVTRLTPRQLTRSPDNLYPIEVAFDSTQQSLRWETLQATVLVGSQAYPMTAKPLMTNRWETLIPVPPGTKTVEYRVKFDFFYNAWGEPPQEDTALSKIYKLQINDNSDAGGRSMP